MKVFVMVADSCLECNTRCVRVFSSEPTDANKKETLDAMDNMWCINVNVYELNIDEIVTRIDLYYGR